MLPWILLIIACAAIFYLLICWNESLKREEHHVQTINKLIEENKMWKKIDEHAKWTYGKGDLN